MKKLKIFAFALLSVALLCQSCDEEKQEMNGVVSFETAVGIDSVCSAAKTSQVRSLFNELCLKDIKVDVAKQVINQWSVPFVGMDSLEHVIDNGINECKAAGIKTYNLLMQKKAQFEDKVSKNEYGEGKFKVSAYLVYYYLGAPGEIKCDSVIFQYPLEEPKEEK